MHGGPMDTSTDIWKSTSIGALGLLVATLPFIYGTIPNHDDISHMIATQAPIAVSGELKQIIETQNQIKIEQAKTATTLETLSDRVMKAYPHRHLD
jgi:Ser-tRNA(Ala) deacylase AlaX